MTRPKYAPAPGDLPSQRPAITRRQARKLLRRGERLTQLTTRSGVVLWHAAFKSGEAKRPLAPVKAEGAA